MNRPVHAAAADADADADADSTMTPESDGNGAAVRYDGDPVHDWTNQQ